MRPKPRHTYAVIHRTSFHTTYAHHRTSTLAAIQNRIGRMVSVHSHASRHARAPKQMVRSRYVGSSKKFLSRSSLTACDSYGMSDVYEWWMYSGLGRWPASSSCNTVGSDMGGSGIDGGIGNGMRWSLWLDGIPGATPAPSRCRGCGRAAVLCECRRVLVLLATGGGAFAAGGGAVVDVAEVAVVVDDEFIRVVEVVAQVKCCCEVADVLRRLMGGVDSVRSAPVEAQLR